MKKGLRITAWIVGILLFLLLALCVAVQSPTVQTALARRAVSLLGDNLDGDIRIGSVSVRPFDAIVLEDVVMTDRSPYSEGTRAPLDTIARIGNLSARFSLKGLLHKERVSVSRLRLEDGVFNLVIEPDGAGGSTLNLSRVLQLAEKDPDKPRQEFGDLLEAGKVEIENFTFRMVNHVSAARRKEEGRDPVPENVIDWNDLEIHAGVHVSDLLVKDGVVSGKAEHIALSDKTGLEIRNASGDVKVGHGEVLLKNLHVQDRDSDLYMRSFSLLGTLENDYPDFLNRVRLEGNILPPSVLSMQTVSHFGPNLEDYTFKADVTGQFEGTVNNLSVKNIHLKEHASGVQARVDGTISGLPDIQETRLDYTVRDFRFTPSGLGTFIQEWAPDTRLDLGKFGKGMDFRLDATAKGLLNDLAVKGNLLSNAGEADVDIKLKDLVDRSRPIAIGGNVKTRNLDIGRIAGIQALGPVSLETGLEATLAQKDLQVRVDSLSISRLHAMGYDYTGIQAQGSYSPSSMDGRVIVHDPSLRCIVQGRFDSSATTRNEAYDLYANVAYADLNALNLYKQGAAKVSLQANAKLTRTRDKDMLADIGLLDVVLENETGSHTIGDILASAHSNEDIFRIRFESDLAEGTFVGDKSPVAMVSDLKELLVRRHLPSLLEKDGTPWDGSPYEIHFTVHDNRQLLGAILPGLYIEKNSKASLVVDKDGRVDADVVSGRLALGDKFLKDVRINVNNWDDVLRADVAGGIIKIGDLELRDNRLSVLADEDSFGLSFSFENEGETTNKADVHLDGGLSREDGKLVLTANANPSHIIYDGESWNLDTDDITFKGGDIRIGRARISNGGQSLLVDGGLSGNHSDTLNVRMEKFNISLLNSFLMDGQLDLRGLATGRARLVSPTKPNLSILAGIVCDSTYIAGRPAGEVQLGSVWNETEERFDFRLGNRLGDGQNIAVEGFLRPSDKRIRADVDLNRLDMGYASPILDGIFNRFEGGLDGKVHVDGTLDKLQIASEGMQIVDGVLGIAFTQVPYHVAGPVALDTEGLHFKEVSITDGEEGKGSVTGSLLFGGFKDMRLDTHVQFDRMKVLGIPGVARPVSGQVYGSGRVDITGPFNALVLSVDARTVKDGDLHIPLSTGSSQATGDLLVFKEPEVEVEEDPYEKMMVSGKDRRKKSKNDLDIRLRVRATPAVTAYIDIGENSLQGLGSGLIDLDVRPNDKLFTINGDYTLSQGNFRFSALNMVSREFTIQDGSRIRFNGEVMDSDLNVTGVYTTKADISTLLSTTSTDQSSSRRQVNCIIGISDKLRNPQLQFDIEIPELDPGTEGLVNSALNTEDKVMKQFLYLLIANSFLPNDDSGIISSGGSNMLVSNVTGIMAGQLNSIFQKLDIPLDLGLNYQQNDSGNNIFDVALSTQLFNNRVIVNGTIGNRRLYGTTTEEVTGDLDIDIKLDKPGTFRLNLFSHSADQYTSYLDNSQRNGVGIAYQREFNSFPQFFRDLFSPRKAREEHTGEEALRPAERVVLQIDSTGKAHPVLPHHDE